MAVNGWWRTTAAAATGSRRRLAHHVRATAFARSAGRLAHRVNAAALTPSHRALAARVGSVGFGLAVFVVGMLPTQGRSDGYLTDWFRLPAPPAAIPASVLAVAAVAALWSLPRQWPLVTVALAGPLFATIAPGLCVIAATFVAASRFRRAAHLAGFLLALHLVALVPVALGLAFGVEGLDGEDLAGALGGTVLFVWPPLALGLWSHDRRRAVAALREHAEHLEHEHAEAQSRARIRERTRIAREMHDVVAHEVSLVVMHAGALEVNATDPATAESAELIRATGAAALTRLRDVLGVLRSPDDDAPLSPPARLSDLDALIRDSRAAGVAVGLRTTGRARELPPLTENTAHSIILEGLTNVRKHAGAVTATVELDYRTDHLKVTVHNQAPASPPRPLPGGLGLVGLRERVALSGGNLCARTNPEGGFTLSAELPATGRE